MSSQTPSSLKNKPNVKVIGVGGAGINILNGLAKKNLETVSFLSIDTDLQNLQRFQDIDSILIGRHITRGLSTGGDVQIGRQVAQADQSIIADALKGVDLLFLVGSLGGGTGAGIMPLIAQKAAQEGVLAIVFAFMPFAMEGSLKWSLSEETLTQIRSTADAVIVVPNDILLQQVSPQATVIEAFSLANSWVYRAVHAMTSILFKTGFINLDFATLRQAFSQKGGKTLFALGQGNGEDYLKKAFSSLALCPLLHTIEQSRAADNIVVQIIAGEDFSISNINSILSFLNDQFGTKHKVCLGAVIEPEIKEYIQICVLGTTQPESLSRGVGKAKKFTVDSSKKTVKPKTPVSIIRNWVNPNENQGEFSFMSQGQMRGYFDETDRNNYDGEDLDVPTYLRKGIKIIL